MKELNYQEITTVCGGSELSDLLCYLWGWIIGTELGKIEYCSDGNMASIVAYK